jgi:hypothetical protein
MRIVVDHITIDLDLGSQRLRHRSDALLHFIAVDIADFPQEPVQCLADVITTVFHVSPPIAARKTFFKRARSRNSFSAIAPRETPSIRAISASL